MISNRECEVPELLEITLTNFRCPTATVFEVWIDLHACIHRRNLSEPVMFMEGKGTLGLRHWQGDNIFFLRQVASVRTLYCRRECSGVVQKFSYEI